MKTFITATWGIGVALIIAKALGIIGDGLDLVVALITLYLLGVLLYRWGGKRKMPGESNLCSCGKLGLWSGLAVTMVLVLVAVFLAPSPWASPLIMVPAIWQAQRGMSLLIHRLYRRQPGTHHAALIRHGILLARQDHTNAHAGEFAVIQQTRKRTWVERPGGAPNLTDRLVVRAYRQTIQRARTIRAMELIRQEVMTILESFVVPRDAAETGK